MKLTAIILFILFSNLAYAGKGNKFDFYFKEKEIIKILDKYSDLTDEKFIVDSSVRGRTSILFHDEITQEEAFNALSSSLALNGYAILREGNYWRVLPARVAQRSNLPVVTDLPSEQPIRMVTFVYKAKNRKAEELFKNLRVFNSKDGEVHVDMKKNLLLITDWTNNLQRVAGILNEVDKK